MYKNIIVLIINIIVAICVLCLEIMLCYILCDIKSMETPVKIIDSHSYFYTDIDGNEGFAYYCPTVGNDIICYRKYGEPVKVVEALNWRWYQRENRKR